MTVSRWLPVTNVTNHNSDNSLSPTPTQNLEAIISERLAEERFCPQEGERDMRKRTPQKLTEEQRQMIISTIAELTPEQQSQFPEDVKRGNRSFTIEEKWLLEELSGFAPRVLTKEEVRRLNLA